MSGSEGNEPFRFNLQKPLSDLIQELDFARHLSVTPGEGVTTFSGPPTLLHGLFFLRGVLEVMEDHSDLFRKQYGSEDLSLLFKVLRDILDHQLTAQEAIKQFKYWTVYPLWRHAHLRSPLENPAPSIPFPKITHQLFGGRFGRYISTRILSTTCSATCYEKNLSLFFSLLQGPKRSAAQVTPDFIASALRDHQEVLGTKVGPPSLDSYTKARRLLKDFISCTLSTHLTYDYSNVEVSSSSSYVTKRSEGGQRGEVLDLRTRPDKGWNGKVPLSEFLIPQDVDFVLDGSQLVSVPVHHTRTFTDLLLEMEIDLEERDPYGSGISMVRIVPLVEPFKVRVISAGDARLTHLSRAIQRPLQKYVEELPFGRNTTAPFGLYDLESLLDRERKFALVLEGQSLRLSKPGMENSLKYDSLQLFGSDWAWVSGDYKAATDNLNISYTLMAYDLLTQALSKNTHAAVLRGVMEPVGAQIADRLVSMCRLNLDGLLLEYPEKYDLPEHFVEMENGQLMGSILSFPILCILNALAYLKTWTVYLREESFNEEIIEELLPGLYRNLPVIVNGDDILFRANPRFYELWQRELSDMGFKLSLGKNYYSSQFLTINSEMWIYPTHEIRRLSSYQPKKVRYLNTGLLISDLRKNVINRSEKIEEKKKQRSLRDLYRMVQEGSWDHVRTHRCFFKYYGPQILDLVPGYCNPFLASELGGLGFPLFPGVETRITPLQRKYAVELLQRWKFLRYKALDFEYFKPEDILPITQIKFEGLSRDQRPPVLTEGLGWTVIPRWDVLGFEAEKSTRKIEGRPQWGTLSKTRNNRGEYVFQGQRIYQVFRDTFYTDEYLLQLTEEFPLCVTSGRMPELLRYCERQNVMGFHVLPSKKVLVQQPAHKLNTSLLNELMRLSIIEPKILISRSKCRETARRGRGEDQRMEDVD